jgi:hypothetical protein
MAVEILATRTGTAGKSMLDFRRLVEKLKWFSSHERAVGQGSSIVRVRFLKLTLTVLVSLAVPLGFNACGQFGAVSSLDLGSAFEYSAAPNLLNGEELYSSKCAVCHQPLQQSQKRNATVSAITGAVGSIPDMSLLKGHLTRCGV